MFTLTLIFPVFNESSRIASVFKALESYVSPGEIEVKNIVFVDDGSTDITKKIIEAWQNSHKDVKLISYKTNLGRGYALRQALTKVETDYALYLDGDMAVSLENIEYLVPHIKNGVDLVAGSKKKPGARCQGDFNLARTIIGLGHSAIAFFILGVFYWDFQGGFKLFSRRLAQQVVPLTTINRWGFDMEIIFLAEKLGYKCQEIPIFWKGYGSDSRVKLIRDIFSALRDMVDIRWRWETKFANKFALTQKTPDIAY